jgi:hypothetical protein
MYSMTISFLENQMAAEALLSVAETSGEGRNQQAEQYELLAGGHGLLP